MSSIAESEQHPLQVGRATVVKSLSPATLHGVVFEDDGETGYLYGLDLSLGGNPIVDAMQIYEVDRVPDRHLPSIIQILWSRDGLKCALTIDGYWHAVFDFEMKRGYCRSGFPVADRKWTVFDHSWDDRAIDLIA